MGNIYYKQKKFPLAAKMYRMALDETPSAYKETRYRILQNIGNAFMRLGQYQVLFVLFSACILKTVPKKNVCVCSFHL